MKLRHFLPLVVVIALSNCVRGQVVGSVNGDGRLVLTGENISISFFEIMSAGGHLIPFPGPQGTMVDSPFHAMKNSAPHVIYGSFSPVQIDGQLILPTGYSRPEIVASDLSGTWASRDAEGHIFWDGLPPDSDGDGQLDLLDTPGFDVLARQANYSDRPSFGIQDLDGANQLTQATELHLAMNQIGNVEPGDFEGLDLLESLDLKNNQLATIMVGAFEGLSNLQSLRMENNEIATIEPGGFQGLDSLKSLSLNNNRIASMAADGLNGLARLESLDLGSNRIETIEPGAMRMLGQLRRLNLINNQLTTIEAGSFQGLTGLRSLNLENNHIVSIDAGGFDGLANLNSLDLAWNSLATVGARTFEGLHQLQHLGLENAGITRLEADAFQGLSELRHLNLSGNDIAEIEPGAFRGLSLGGLSFAAIKRGDMEPGTFLGLRVDHLDLADMGMTRIDRGTFDGLSVTSLDFFWRAHCCLQPTHPNQITTIEAGAFESLTELRELYLDASALDVLHAGVLRGLTNLETLAVRGNPSVEPGAFAGLQSLRRLSYGTSDNIVDLSGVDFSHPEFELDLTVWADDFQLVLDDAAFSPSAFDTSLYDLMSEATELSMVGTDLIGSASIPIGKWGLARSGLRKLTIDEELLNTITEDQVREFQSQEGNTLTIIPHGDANQDQQVNFADFVILSGNYGGEGRWSDGDFNRDQVVGFADFVHLSANFSNTVATPVPEPDVRLLLVTAMAVSLVRRRSPVATFSC